MHLDVISHRDSPLHLHMVLCGRQEDSDHASTTAWRQRHMGSVGGEGHRGPLRHGHGLRVVPGIDGLCSSKQVKPGSGWQEQGATLAEVAVGRSCGTTRLWQRPKAGSGVGGKWQKKVGGAARWRQRHVGRGQGWVCRRGPLATPMVQGMHHMGMGNPNSEAGQLYDP